MERRDGRWAIAARKCLMDGRGTPGEYDLTPEQFELTLGAGPTARDSSGPSYERPQAINPKRITDPSQGTSQTRA
jgi:hypothetical protein